MGRLDELNARLADRMDAMNKRLAGRAAMLNTQECGSVTDAADVPEDPLEAWLQPDSADIKTLFDYVRRSRVVLDNPSYSAALASVDLVYLTDPADSQSNSVNAGACYDGRMCKVEIYAGIARQARIAGCALASKDGVEAFKRFLKIVESKPALASSISMRESKLLFLTLGLQYDEFLADETMRQEAVSRSSAAILSTLAHEAGHIVLGHVKAKVNYYNVNREVARMQERQADSFMSSVISTVPFGEYMFEAELFNDYLNAVAERAEAQRNRVETTDSWRTHPLSIERFNNLLKDHPDLAEKYDLKPLNAV